MPKYLKILFATSLIIPSFAFAKDIDCSNVITQRDMNYCAALDFREADADLNHDYQYAKRAMERVDANLAKQDRGAVKALINAQRAWIKYRDQACFAEAYPNFGGSIRPLIETSCKTKLTQERIQQLRILIDTN